MADDRGGRLVHSPRMSAELHPLVAERTRGLLLETAPQTAAVEEVTTRRPPRRHHRMQADGAHVVEVRQLVAGGAPEVRERRPLGVGGDDGGGEQLAAARVDVRVERDEHEDLRASQQRPHHEGECEGDVQQAEHAPHVVLLQPLEHVQLGRLERRRHGRLERAARQQEVQ